MATPRLTGFVLALTTLAYFGNSVYLPFVDHMAREFGVSNQAVQLTLSSYLVGLGLPQLVYGPLSDRFGRRPVLAAAMAMFVAASALCVAAPSIALLIAARALQGMSASAFVVLSRAIIRDAFAPAERRRVIGHVGVAAAMAPMLGPIVFGALLPLPWWRASLAVTGVIGVAMLGFVCWRLQETRPGDTAAPLSLRGLGSSFRSLFQNRQFTSLTVAMCSAYAALFCWYSWTGFILIDELSVAPRQFGYFFAITVLGFMIGSFAGGRGGLAYPLQLVLLAGAGLMLAGASALLAAAFLNVAAPLWIAVTVMLLNAGVGIVMPQALMGALQPFAANAGTASGVLGTTQMLLSGLVATLPGLIPMSHLRSLSVVAVLLSALAAGAVVQYSALARAASKPAQG